MTPLLSLRLAQQQIARHDFQTAADAAAWMGAMQAQDYLGAKWSLSLRLPGSTDSEIERAIADRTIVRTTSLRGTLHFLAAADVRWMLRLLAPRVLAGFAGRCRAVGLEESDFGKSEASILSALSGGRLLTRAELLRAIANGGVSAAGERANYLLYRAALDGVICQGVRRGKEFTFALLDEWSPGGYAFEGDAASAELARRYFHSHGPATAGDFAWWSGQTMGAARAALEMVRRELAGETWDGVTYWMSPSASAKPDPSPSAYLLPGFDEYFLGYADRGAVIAEEQSRALTPKNGIFTPLVIVNGRAAGTWKRTLQGRAVAIETIPFAPWTREQAEAVAVAVERCRTYLVK